jgi:hypothetical protein
MTMMYSGIIVSYVAQYIISVIFKISNRKLILMSGDKCVIIGYSFKREKVNEYVRFFILTEIMLPVCPLLILQFLY